MPKFISNKFTTDIMSLLTQASLIVTPNGYKEGKLYSVIPSDGSGDLSVTRATTATRVNSAGLVELVPYNLFSYSQNLANVAWSTYAASGTITRTANYATAPDGSTTATRIQNSGGDPIQWTYQNIALASNGIISMYVKRTGATNQTFRFFSNNGATFSSNFTATDTWQRFEFAVGSNSGALPFGITTDSSGTAADILVWGAQIVEGSTAKDYQKTETRLNIPRLDYSNGTCPSLLVEPQRTNGLLYSEQFNNGAAWGGNGIASYQYVSNPVTGLNNAMKITKVTGNTDPYFQQGVGAGAGAWTYSMWLWTDSGQPTTAAFYMFNSTISEFYAQSITLTNVPTRYTFTSNFTNTGGYIIVRTVLSGADANQYIYAYGGQAEFGTYATSYIPTTSASVTRNADLLTKTSATALIGQTEGTLFVDAYITGKDSSNGSILFATDKASSGALIRIIYTSTNALRFDVFDGSSFQCILSAGAYNVGDRVKVAGGYKNNDFVMYVNGTQIGTDTSGSVPATDTANINTSIYGDTNGSFVNAAALWKTRLTNTQLEALTGPGFNTYAQMAEYYNYVLQ